MKNFNASDITPIVADGLVLYCDGSARPNPGFVGAGVHGYAYSTDTPKKGTGLGTHTMTQRGYFDNKELDKGKPITPIQYYNIAASFDFQTTNNVAELLAAHVAMRVALASGVKKLLIKTDSEYVVKVITKFAAMWVRSNWLKRDGTPVNNQQFIKELIATQAEMQAKDITLDIQWVKGHSTHIGNIAADKLANIGSAMSRSRKIEINIQERDPAGYWKQDNTRHPFLSHRRMYFATQATDMPVGMYFLGDHGKEDDFVGRAEVDGALSIAYIKKPDVTLDTIIARCKELAGAATHFFFARLDSIFARGRQVDIQKYREASLIVEADSVRLNLVSGDDTELVRDLQPIRLSERTFDALAAMRERLVNHLAGNDTDQTVVNDITSTFYESNTKIVKNETLVTVELLKKFVVGYRCEKVPVKHAKGEKTLILTLGIDIPDRNALKHLETMSPTVKLLTWMESDHCMRYATIITTGAGDSSIWCGYYANQIYLE